MAPIDHDYVVRSVRRLASGDVEIQVVPPDLRLLVVVVPFARSSFADMDNAVRTALAHRKPAPRG